MKGNENRQTNINNNKNSIISDIILSLIFIIFAVLMFIGGLNIVGGRNTEGGFLASAYFTPLMLSIIIIILSSFIILRNFRHYKIKLQDIKSWVKKTINDKTVHRVWVLISIISIYVILIGHLNFIIVNFIFLFGMYIYLRVFKVFIVFVYSVLGAIVIGYVVPLIFQMALP